MNAFNGRLISALSSDRLYRVFFDQGEVFFIQIGGQQGIGWAIAVQFGVLGALIYAPFQRRAQEKLEAKIKDFEMQPPSALLAAGKHNFHAFVSDFESSSLQAAPALGGHGQHVGRWVMQLRGQKPMTLQLETTDDMRRALEALPGAIAAHVNQVAWDAAKGKFVKTA